jgi:hypothetical protein
MLAGSFRRSPHRGVLRLRLLDHFIDDRRMLEQLHLRRQHFPFPVDALLSDFEPIAAHYPVYRIDPS